MPRYLKNAKVDHKRLHPQAAVVMRLLSVLLMNVYLSQNLLEVCSLTLYCIENDQNSPSHSSLFPCRTSSTFQAHSATDSKRERRNWVLRAHFGRSPKLYLMHLAVRASAQTATRKETNLKRTTLVTVVLPRTAAPQLLNMRS